jgi:signal transduction histidine kinase
MQSVESVLNILFVLSFFVLYGTVTWGLFRYSTKQSYRFWALGWVLYSIGGLEAGFSSAEGFVLPDLFGLVCLYTGATLILNGSRDTAITRNRMKSMVAAIFALLVGGVMSLLYPIPFYVIFGILGVYIAYVCLYSVRIVQGLKDVNDMSKAWLTGGLMIWAISWIFFPVLAPTSFYAFVLILQSAGVIITGASMLTYFIGRVTRSLEQQYQVSQIMSSLIQHDIRNYIQVAKSALDLTEETSLVERHWIGIASDSLNDAGEFINEMRDISALIARPRSGATLTSLDSVISPVLNRVTQEYSLDSEQIQTSFSSDIIIKFCPLSKEILWNIFDNAFKHGSSVLYVREVSTSESAAVIEITDRGGGLSQRIRDFLNSPDSLLGADAPGLGLGIVLIHGLAIICGIGLHVDNVIEDCKVVGSKFILSFQR